MNTFKNTDYKISIFFSNRYTDSVTVLTTQKERTVSIAKQVIMTDHGDLQLLKTPMNVEVRVFLIKWSQLFERWINLSTGKKSLSSG